MKSKKPSANSRGNIILIWRRTKRPRRGNYGLRHYGYMLQNPKPKLFNMLQREGERATWPKISSIEAHARIGKTIQHCLEILKSPQVQSSMASDLHVPA